MVCKTVSVPGPGGDNGSNGGIPGFIQDHPGATIAAGGLGLAMVIRTMKGEK